MAKPPEPRAKIPSRASIPDAPAKPPEAKKTSSHDIPPPELAEVERALSILQGRHPDAVRAERETLHTLETKKAEAEARAELAGAEEKRRWIVRGIVGILLTAASVVGWTQY